MLRDASLHVRPFCLHCRRGDGSPLGLADKKRFASTHNGLSHYIFKSKRRFEI